MAKINANKADDIYKIKPAIIKDLADYLPPIITPLFNRSIDENEYPDALKYTKVIELYKGGDRTLPVSYRPISLLPILAKLLDTIINDQLTTYLLDNDMLSPTQYAFRPNSNTTLALQAIINEIHKSKTNKQPVLAIYVDLSKAYDTVSHEKLINKLRTEFNFSDDTATFFEWYFKNRHQSTHTTHAQSDMQVITHGIPQGSTLSTTLFLLYINNIISTVQSKVYTYADDTTLIVTVENIKDLQANAQSDLTDLIRYFHDNNLVPNPTKTTYTTFKPTNGTEIKLEIQGTAIEHTDTAKLLGIYVQDSIKYDRTISHVVKKLQHTIRNFRYATTILPRMYMKRQYYAHAYPHLIYAIGIWGTQDASKQYIQPLIRTHKKIIRIVCNMPPRTHTQPLMQELELLNLTNIYKLRVCAEMHPYIYQNSDKPLKRPYHDNKFLTVANVHMHGTRFSANHIFTPNPNKYMQAKLTAPHFTNLHSEIWNSLPPELTQIDSLNVIKKQLKQHLLTKQQNLHD